MMPDFLYFKQKHFVKNIYQRKNLFNPRNTKEVSIFN